MDYFLLENPDTLLSLTHYVKGIKYDVVFALIIGLITTPIFMLFRNQSANCTKKITVYITVFLVSMISLYISEYFWQMNIPLDEVIFAYSFKESVEITKSSTSINLPFIIRSIILLFSSIGLPFLFFKKKKFSNQTILITTVILLFVGILSKGVIPKIERFSNNSLYYKQLNKSSYFTKSIISYKTSDKKMEGEIGRNSYHNLLSQNNYTSKRFPLMRERDSSNVLGSYFSLQEDMPNIVLIIIESLSSRFSGPNAKVASFTPFIDSLATQGLYWRNFFSTSERTFNILPSVLASAPYGERGFTFLAEKQTYPKVLSLSSILQKNGYENRFLYGCWTHFDYMDNFLTHIGFSSIVGLHLFDTLKYQKMPATSQGFSWGFPDDALFSFGSEINTKLHHSPFLNVFLTISTHDPYLIHNQDFWIKKATQQIQNSSLDEKAKNKLSNYKRQLSTLLFTDNALRDFFKEEEKSDHFNNTIYVICGDHNIFIGDYDILDKYGVPLVIYSPLLKESKIFPAVSSTADITPTLLNLLDSEYSIGVPKEVPWIGSLLDTCSRYQSKCFIPMMRQNRTINELIWNDYFYSEGRVFKMGDHRTTTLINDPHKLSEMTDLINGFKAINYYTCSKKMIYHEGNNLNLSPNK